MFEKIKIPAKLQSFLSDSMIYTLVNVGNKAIPFLLLPLIIRIVSPAEYGTYALFLTVETLLIPIVSLNMYSAFGRHFFLEDIDLQAYISTLIIFLTAFTAILCGIALVLPDAIVLLSGLSSRMFAMAIFTAYSNSVGLLVMVLFRNQRKPWLYGAYLVGQSVLLLSCVLLFSKWQPNAEMLAVGRSIAFLVFLLLSVVILLYKKFLTVIIDRQWLERMLRFSVPTILFSVSAFIFAGSDRLQIEHFLGSEAVGHYSAIAQISGLVSVISTSFNAAWMPWLFENLKKEDASLRFFIVKLSYALMLGFLVLGLVFGLMMPFIAQIVLTAEYLPYLYVSYPLILGFVFQGLYFIVGPFLWYTEKTQYLGYGGIGIAALNILLNLVFIPRFGILGAAFANSISWCCLFLFTFFIANKVYAMPWLFFLKKSNSLSSHELH